MNFTEMLASYLNERQGLKVLITDEGFAIYKCENNECFIADFYLRPEVRGTKALLNLVGSLEELARSASCKVLTGHIHCSAKGSDRALLAALKIGFRIRKSESNINFIFKEVK